MIEIYKKLQSLLDYRERRNFFILIGVMVAEALMEMLGIGIIPVFITLIAFPETLSEHALFVALKNFAGGYWPQGKYLIYAGSAMLLVFFVSKMLVTIASTYIKTKYAHNRALKLSKRLFSAYLKAPYVFHLKHGSTELIRNINGECTLLSNNVLMPIINLMTQSIILAGIIIILVISVPAEALVWVIVFLVLGMGFAKALNKHVRVLGKDAQEKRVLLLKVVREGLEGVKEINLMHRSSYFSRKMGALFSRLLQIQRIMTVLHVVLPSLIELVTIIGLLGVTVMLFASGQGSETVIPVLTVFTVALVRMKGSMKSIMSNYAEVQHSGVSLDIVHSGLQQLENLEHDRMKTCDAKESDVAQEVDFNDRIELRGISYKYPESDEYALRNIDISIHKGESIGIVGTTGAGKSTFIDVLLGVLRPSDGAMTIDGLDIAQSIPQWQKKIGYIPQMIFLVDGSITDNVALGVDINDIDHKLLEQAVFAANLEVLLQRLPEGLDTVVGERGVRLSGGERQRIVIARALYNNPEVLIMDEATSALDNVTENSVIRELESLKGDRTVLMIAHRLSTVRRCDRILFLKDGEIDAIGSYDELAESHPEFMRMTELT